MEIIIPSRVSGLTGEGLEALLARIDEAMPVDPLLHLHFTLPLSNGRAIALVHALGPRVAFGSAGLDYGHRSGNSGIRGSPIENRSRANPRLNPFVAWISDKSRSSPSRRDSRKALKNQANPSNIASWSNDPDALSGVEMSVENVFHSQERLQKSRVVNGRLRATLTSLSSHYFQWFTEI